MKIPSKPVGIWIRVSTEDQAKGESPEHHERRAKAYCESKDWKVKEVYHLEAVSGKSVMDHPETQRMLEHIKTGHITGLIFSKLARLARNTRELLDFADLLRWLREKGCTALSELALDNDRKMRYYNNKVNILATISCFF